MKKSVKVFLTGTTGFLGSCLRSRLQRPGSRLSITELPRAAGANLLTPLSYQRELADADTVVHLAAATGKVSVATHFRVNAEGTRVLLEQCQQSGVRRFVFVSSIATKYPDLRHYPYARAKLEAETAVVSSGLDFTIVRPTIIAGPGSSVLTALGRLASLPVVPIFGTGQVRVQPILVDDLADCLVSVIRDGLASCQTIELGGPEVITIEHLLGKLRHILTGKPMRHIRVPLAPLLPILALLETAVYRAMPVTVGQFSTFRFDGIASANPVFEQHYTRMTGLSRMIEVSFKP